MMALVVDDSSTMRKVLKSILSTQGFEVAEAPDGSAALTWLAEHHAELALFDWNMPEMTGVDLLARVRAEKKYDAMKIMMCTTETEQSEVIRALNTGADEYVMKPFTKESIVDKLHLLGF